VIAELVRERRVDCERYEVVRAPVPPITLLVHGTVAQAAIGAAIAGCGVPLREVVWTCADAPPAAVACVVDRRSPAIVAREATEHRGDRAVAFLDASAAVPEGWLAELAAALYGTADGQLAAFVVPPSAIALASCDARAALLALHEIPQHERLAAEGSLDDALAAFAARLRGYARTVVGVPHPCGMRDARPAFVDGAAIAPAPHAPEAPLVSIVTLSWNAPEYTKTALASIRRFTTVPHEVIVVDNGSGPETTAWLRTVADVRVVWNAENLGFAHGCNQGIAAARGSYVVLLNNDVVVTEGWLDDLLDAHRRNPGIGVTAPRSNRIAGNQLVADATYGDLDAMHRFAAGRRAAFRKAGYFTDRAIGFCLCIDRRVIDEIGGIDERYGIGNFEDDDFCIRVRAAGYAIYVCDDVFIHHFGSISFQANSVDYRATMHENWRIFARKWGLPDAYPEAGYQPQPIIARGFARTTDFVALPEHAETAAPPLAAVDEPAEPMPVRGTTFVAVVRDEADWSEIAAIVRRFARAFDDAADARLAIAVLGALDAAALGARIEKLVIKEGRTAETVGDIAIDDVDDAAAWLAALAPTHAACVQRALPAPFDVMRVLDETSPSALKRAVADAVRA
jgi:GT2 family glycosyltransferase